MISMTLKTVQQTTFNVHQIFPLSIYEKKISGFLPSLYKSFEEVLERNVQKLEKRYPGGSFDIHDSENRAADDL